VAVLGPNLLELLLVLGGQSVAFGDHIRFHAQDYTDPATQIPYLGDRITTRPVNLGSDFTPNLEALLKSQPDLILAPSFLPPDQQAALAGIAPTLLLDWFETETNLRAIAAALDKPAAAEAALAELDQTVAAARQTFAPLVAQSPQVLMLSATDLKEIRLFTSQENYCAELVETLGFESVAPPGQEVAPLSVEALPQFNEADLTLLFGVDWAVLGQPTDGERFEQHQVEPLRRAWQQNAIAQSLDASQAGRVYFLPAYLCLGLPGPIGTELYLNELKRQLLPPE
jgi:iron complex transport system substrate-binding protein